MLDVNAPARSSDQGPVGPDGVTGGSGASDEPRPQAVRPPDPAELVARAAAQWRAALVDRAGYSALADVERLGDAQLDLSAAHPSGLAQLLAGRETHLSNLVREGAALSSAKRRARAVGALADDHAQRYGLASAFLAIGVATWTEQPEPVTDDVVRLAAATAPQRDDADDEPPQDGAAQEGAEPAEVTRTVRAPVLLRPVAIRARGRGESDYALVLDPSLEINPLLATALRRRGALLDPSALARGAFTENGFDPLPALDRLRALGEAVLEDFAIDDRLLVGTFVHPEQVLLDDLDAQAGALDRHEVLRALAGDERSIDALAHPLPGRLRGDRPLDQERGVGDLDPAQAYVLDAVAAGHHLLVDAPSGSDVAGTLAAVVADAAASGRTVLYVPGHRRAGEALVERLTTLGLESLVVDVPPDSGWRAHVAQRLLSAMTVEPVDVDGEKVAIVQRELLNRRGRLQSYVAGLHERREPWGCSAYDALQALARLTATRPAPSTRVRLTAPVAEALTGERRAQAAADLVRAAGLGAFSTSARQTPWYGADLPTPDRAHRALARLDHLLDEALPRLRTQAAEVADATGLTPATTLADWGEQLRMLAGVRGALDVFQPLVFERSAADMVAATATKEWRAERGIDMPGSLRRRLRKQAKDMVRPGRPVADLHAALVDVQAQREVWQAHCPAGGWPRVPTGMAEIEADHAEALAEVEELSAVLATTPAGGELLDLRFDALVDRLERLRQDRGALETLPERTALVRSLDRRGLGALLTDLADRRVGAGLVAAELDLAWWSTVFEEILRLDPALAGYDGAALTRLVAEFRTLDRRYLSDRGVLALAMVREDLRSRLRSSDEQTQSLFAEIVEQRFAGLRQAVERYPDVTRHLRPCLVASPMLVPHVLPPARTEDLVILDAAGHLPLETVVGALARGRQVLVVGDTRSASGSALTELAAVLPAVALHADTSRRDPHLTELLTRHGYAGRLSATPLPTRTSLLRLDLVDGTGMPAANGAVEGTPAEVEHVVELVLEHALTRPEESLAVVTASAVHAERVRDAVLTEVRQNPSLGEFFRPGRSEPFAVVEVGATQGLSREAVILSVGFGRTPHGRVLHRFGALSEPGGDGRLLEALGSTRHRLTVVSCFGAEDLDPERLRAPGARLLADLLELTGSRTGVTPGERTAPEPQGEPDRLVLDLAERLWRTGLTVELDHGIGEHRIPLAVGHPDLPDEMLVAVLTDDDDYVGEPSVRVRDRQAPERLERLGWSVVQVWSAAAFLDPQGEADAICDVAVETCGRRLAERRARRPVMTAPPVLVDAGPEGQAGEEPSADEPHATDEAHATGGATSVGDGQDVPASEAAPTPAPAPVRGTALGAAHDLTATGILEASRSRPTPPVAARGVRGPRPRVERGLPIAAYTDDQLDELVAWIRSDGVARTDDELAAVLRGELGLTRRGSRIDAVVGAAVRRQG